PFPEDLDSEAINRAFDESWDCADRAQAPSRGQGCEWLYKHLAMDAGGRIMPCCCSPRNDGELIFGHVETEPDSTWFNSSKHRLARRLFAGQIDAQGH